ncbi:MAG: phosphomannose isomerase type II C-terminal cupin domain [Vampirovibrionales bacterium]|nr:phosphomannose isomerase type II C-terminal cupin domain [Vampirovibrionales bacterium]
MNGIPTIAAPVSLNRPPDDVRPWGCFWVLVDAPTHKVKQLQVTPGHRLSLQRHKHRQEHWVVAQGLATITVDDRTWDAPAGEMIFIPQGAVHRLANHGTEIVTLIELQLGTYFGEDDIERLQDDYKRQE